MSKFLALSLAVLMVLSVPVCFADVQIDEGQMRGTGAIKFFVARNGRVGQISKDRVVVWDTTSKDGFTVTTTTTSFDRMIAGITLDEIPGISSDNLNNRDRAYNNWGRVQTWGIHNDVKLQSGSTVSAAKNPVCTSSTAGYLGDCKESGLGELHSQDNTAAGFALEAVTASEAAGTIDIMVKTD